MRLTVRKGRGYSPADSRQKKDDETRSVGKLLLDASYSPVFEFLILLRMLVWRKGN
ncbi:MAG: hypothetical protein Ct9H90mP27_7660 [Gammaproteobacteria bacterium]|nr:MAG: hypothetical protein Ct9H90mP27_7660 [Gammaproteobacteria bacterium]